MSRPKMDLATRFWSKVNKPAPDTCWEFQGAKHNFGYGLFQFAGKCHAAHRIAYQLAYGAIPDGLFVLHNCDNPPCVNPLHLRLGTPADNMQDKTTRKRNNNPIGDRSGRRLHPERYGTGADHPLAKLSSSEVAELRARYTQGGISQRKIAEVYGITQAAANRIIRYITYKEDYNV